MWWPPPSALCRAGEILDGEGGFTVWGRLTPALDSQAAGCFPLGLAHGVRLLNDVAQDQPIRWADVELDPAATGPAYRLRRELEGRSLATAAAQ